MKEETFKKEFVYKLSKPLGVHKKGEKIFINEVLLKAPSVKLYKYRIVLKQVVLSAIQAQQERMNIKSKDLEVENDNHTDTEGPSQEDGILLMVYGYKRTEEIEYLFDAFKNLLINGCGIVDELIFTSAMFEQLDSDDLDGMLGAYIINFIMPSWTKVRKSK